MSESMEQTAAPRRRPRRQASNPDSMLMFPIEAADHLRICLTEIYSLMKTREFQSVIVEIPGVRGKRIHRERLRAFIEKLSPTEATQ